MVFSKTYDCKAHDLLIPKLEAYGLNKTSLNIILNYPNKGKQKTKISSSFSSPILTDVS